MIIVHRETYIAKTFFQTYMQVKLTFYRFFSIGWRNCVANSINISNAAITLVDWEDWVSRIVGSAGGG